MHAVGEVRVQVTGRPEHHRGARRGPPEGVRAGVGPALVRLNLREAQGDTVDGQVSAEQQGRDLEGRPREQGP